MSAGFGNKRIARTRSLPGHPARPEADAERRTPNAERRTPNAERRTPNAERRTPNAERRTPNAERRTPNAERQTPNAKRQTPNAERQTPNAKRQTPNAKRQTPQLFATGFGKCSTQYSSPSRATRNSSSGSSRSVRLQTAQRWSGSSAGMEPAANFSRRF